MPDTSIKSNIDTGQVDPKEVAAIEKSIKATDEAPRIGDQTATFTDWQAARAALGAPFIADRPPPLRKLREMRRDAMFAFALHYRRTPLVRAQWHVDARDKNGANAQVAGYMDSAWRKIHARYIFQHTQDFEFGYAGIIKRFMEGNPGGTYYDDQEADPANAVKPVWDEGNVLPIIWKTFVGLPPERISPAFDDNTGEFIGINYELNTQEQARAQRGGGRQSAGNSRPYDIYHSLWATNDIDSVNGSLYGYPLLAYGYRFWWSYWFLWANLDRAFERMALPPMIAYHPEGDYYDPETNERVPNWQIAQEAAEALRSNAIAAVPSTLATAGLDEKGTQLRDWSFEFLNVPTQNFSAIHEQLNYMDVMKLRSLWVPEQAFVEGEGGTSSRNVAAQMGEIFNESQANKWEEIADHINRFIFPQLLAVNFPEFVNNGGSARIVGHGFATEDVEFTKQIIQLIAQGNPASLSEVDLREALRRIGTPMLNPGSISAQQNQVAAQVANSGPPAVTSTNGVNTIPNPGSTNGGSVPASGAVTAGFSAEPEYIYINPSAHIELSEHDDFLAGLPDTTAYKDKTMRALAVQMRKVWLSTLRELYPDFAKFLADQKIELADDLPKDYDDWDEGLMSDSEYRVPEPLFFAERNRNRRKATRLANKLLRQWEIDSKRLIQASASSRAIIEKMVKRAAVLAGVRSTLDSSSYDEFLSKQTARLVKSISQTTKKNLRSYIVNAIMDDQTPMQIANGIRDHFDEFPDWRADRIARSETRDAYNAGTLIGAKEIGLKYVRAKDAQKGPTDDECEERDGKLFTLREGWKEMDKTHPNDTLELVPIVRANFSIENVLELPEGAPEDAAAWFDSSSDTVYIPLTLSQEDADEFLMAVADELEGDPVAI
jgi:hypothetical protein